MNRCSYACCGIDLETGEGVVDRLGYRFCDRVCYRKCQRDILEEMAREKQEGFDLGLVSVQDGDSAGRYFNNSWDYSQLSGV